MRELSLFSGYGGFTLGLQRLFGRNGVRTIGYCEIAPYCQEIIQAQFQTHDLECMFKTYVITEDGDFSDREFTGTVEFSSSNIVGSGPAIYTRDGEDAGKRHLQGQNPGRQTVGHQEDGTFQTTSLPHQQDAAPRPAQPRTTPAQARVGARGGQETGEWARVTYQIGRPGQLCVEYEEYPQRRPWKTAPPSELLGMQESASTRSTAQAGRTSHPTSVGESEGRRSTSG